MAYIERARAIRQRFQRQLNRGIPKAIVNGDATKVQQWKADISLVKRFCGGDQFVQIDRAETALIRIESVPN